jgi:small subunit ribosomal protein S29
MLTVNSEILKSVELHEDLELDNLSFSAGKSLPIVIRGALGANTRRLAQAPLVLEAVMRSLEKQTL